MQYRVLILLSSVDPSKPGDALNNRAEEESMAMVVFKAQEIARMMGLLAQGVDRVSYS
jgi:hypothetical protein